ncbi:patatin-like phospholipase family protein [Aquariibacter albus]|uniref:Patatin-like phospholipase family protein n=1 Tax=Aquariibacter albus TaxID=2759899 RepID=A0A839HLM3_9BURK|nr:patatin-like phospholipase family protein [Aquariibacter albus]MBB1162202.1 patatin-like phospholipase family protein [Aquariibacter albus]
MPHDPPRPARRHTLRRFAALGLGSLLGGCTLPEDHGGPDAPRELPLARRPRVAWVFSSGGPRGFVHVGVLKALDRLGLVPDLIVGASVGALIGTLRAGGLDAARIEALALSVGLHDLIRLQPGGPHWLGAGGLPEWLEAQLPAPRLQDLPLPMVCVAQRLDDGALVGFTAGEAGLAVQAAAAVVGELAPVRIRGRLYGDADPISPLPVRLARALGAQRVLAVDASAHEDRAPAAAARFREGDLAKRARTAPDAAAADLLLHPDFGYWVNLSRAFRERAIAAGEQAALAQAEALRALHA